MVRGLVTTVDPREPEKTMESEWEEQYTIVEIPEGAQSYKCEFGKNCILKFINDVYSYTDQYEVQLIAFNTTFDFHQII